MSANSSIQSGGMSTGNLLSVGGFVGVAGLLATLSGAPSLFQEIVKINQSTTNSDAIVRAISLSNQLPLVDHNLLNPSVPVQQTVAVTPDETVALVNPPGTNPAAANIFIQPGSSVASDRLIRMAPMGRNSDGEKIYQAVSVTKNQRLICISDKSPDTTYITMIDAQGHRSAAGINAINAARDYLNIANQDSSWAPTAMALADAADHNVTFR